MLPPVVAAVDGSAESFAAAEWAAREAVRRDRPLRLFHAWNWHPRQGDGELATAAQRHLARLFLREAENRVRRACPDARLVPDQLVEGPATAALLKAADEADLLVLGSRGLSGFTGFLVGSVALGVVARAARPVVLVRAGEEAADEHFPDSDGSASTLTGYRDVVLGIDLGDPCDEVIGFAFEEARLRGARLKAVYGWQQPGPVGLGAGDLGLVDPARRAGEWLGFLTAVLQTWRDKYPGVEVAETVTEGRPQSVLVRAASGASLLVVGRRVTERPAGPRTGPVTHAAIHHVDCPVAVVPHV
ncbi:universal stress protein [Streptomyces sp. NBC_00588]|jgi:nucleotide-binding universal stress UspA family protein|uniref:universal stress protein n=1 Tax=Streptomyces sp. NBC_00588 TaxID=2975784 RepID=UPI002E7FD8CB|nr:universal stress protein [Streptomyces sp. NBC_00588]WUB33824.1 universal stress protein [Streptomyces sp. NBC_00588]